MNVDIAQVDAGLETTFPLRFRGGGDASSVNPFVLPYPSVLCFDGLIEQVRAAAAGDDYGPRLVAREILKCYEATPELQGPIRDASVLKRHRELVDLLFTFLVSPIERQTQLFKITRPFGFAPLFVSESLRALIGVKDVCYTFQADPEEVRKKHLLVLGSTILRQCYGVDVDISNFVMLTVPDRHSELKRFYKPVHNERFIRVVVTGDLPSLDREQIRSLLNNLHDTELWLRLLPPASFSFHASAVNRGK